jgi:hypothetical protein
MKLESRNLQEKRVYKPGVYKLVEALLDILWNDSDKCKKN